LGQKLLYREHLVSWSIVMVEKLITAQLHATTSIFAHNMLGLLFGLVK
jgi:hypothetical protein